MTTNRIFKSLIIWAAIAGIVYLAAIILLSSTSLPRDLVEALADPRLLAVLLFIEVLGGLSAICAAIVSRLVAFRFD